MRVQASKELQIFKVCCKKIVIRVAGGGPTFLCSVKKGSVLWRVSNLDDLRSSKQLHDEAGGDNRRDTQLHQSTWTLQCIVLVSGNHDNEFTQKQYQPKQCTEA